MPVLHVHSFTRMKNVQTICSETPLYCFQYTTKNRKYIRGFCIANSIIIVLWAITLKKNIQGVPNTCDWKKRDKHFPFWVFVYVRCFFFIYLNFSGYKRMVFPLKFLNFFLFMDMNLTSWKGMKSDGSNHPRQTKGNGVSCLYMNFYKTAGSFFFWSGHFC